MNGANRMRAQSGIESESGESVAFDAKMSRFAAGERVNTDFRYITQGERNAIADRSMAQMATKATNATRAMVTALRDGAQWARTIDTGNRSYADGWAAAATYAEIVAAQTIGADAD